MLIKKIDPDNILKNNMGLKIKLNFILAHVIIVYWILTSFSWEGVFIGYLSYIFIGKIGGDIGLHRYFTHVSFSTSNFFRKYLIINSSLIGHGSILLWAATHRIHHAKTDTTEDPHSPVNGILKTWLRLWSKDLDIKINQTKDLIKDKWIVFLHKNYFKFFYLWLSLLLVISIYSIYPLLFLFAFPCAGFFHETGIVNTINHKLGYRVYNTNDNSTNNIIVNFLTLGNGMHNTHHAKPYLHTTDIHFKWYEIDFMKYIINIIRKN